VSLAQRFPALTHREFRIYIIGGFISNVGSSIQTFAIMYHVYRLTGQSVWVGTIGLVTVIPLLVFSLLGGVLADQVDRRRMMFFTQSGMALVALALFVMEYAHIASLRLLFGLVAVGAVARALDGPARQPLVASLVPPDHLPNAFSLNGITWRLSEISGPLFAGLFIAFNTIGGISGLAMCYFVNFLSFFAVLYSVYLLSPRPTSLAVEQHARSVKDVLLSIKVGLDFIQRTPVVKSAMWIDFWATFFSGAEALLPALAITILASGKAGYGILGAASGTGALIAAAILAYLPPIRRQGRWVIGMIFLYGGATILLGLSPNLPLAVVFLAIVGAADMISTVMRQTIRQLATPDHMRGRMTATSSLFHISGPRLGDFEAGALASYTGERMSIIIGGAACMLVNTLWLRAKALRDYQHLPAEADPAP
jgi:MFS family permease